MLAHTECGPLCSEGSGRVMTIQPAAWKHAPHRPCPSVNRAFHMPGTAWSVLMPRRGFSEIFLKFARFSECGASPSLTVGLSKLAGQAGAVRPQASSSIVSNRLAGSCRFSRRRAADGRERLAGTPRGHRQRPAAPGSAPRPEPRRSQPWLNDMSGEGPTMETLPELAGSPAEPVLTKVCCSRFGGQLARPAPKVGDVCLMNATRNSHQSAYHRPEPGWNFQSVFGARHHQLIGRLADGLRCRP